jgi:hypothetical protein
MDVCGGQVEKALRMFTAKEILDGPNKYKCSRCGLRSLPAFRLARDRRRRRRSRRRRRRVRAST